MFNQVMGTTQAPQPQTTTGGGITSTSYAYCTTQPKSDLVKEIRKRGAKEFLRDKGDDPTIAKKWLSRVWRVIKELNLFAGRGSISWWEILISVTPEDLIDWKLFLEKVRDRYGRISMMEYKSEFVKLSCYAKNMFQTEKARCEKFELGLRDEIRALVAALDCQSLAAMTVKAYKMETIVQDRSRSFESERIKHEMSSPPPVSNFKKLRDNNFSTSMRDSQFMSFKRDGNTRQTTLME
ncbi:ATP-dependent zinc metalloprotease FtsH [Gossypium australe]|uniref:ATP-dependent zinc metalloprotease FtsH n=1 Tax=Gossypium australe TaxID=47621 RepID=A0A5B6WT05_9ROSI|nr:ATP-dependent zinc metalloprotease FtsH [Gossypium australe]